MNLKKVLVLLVFIGILGSCNNDDNEPEVIVAPPRLLAEQIIDDDAAIKEYLETHFYNYEEFVDPPAGFDYKITIDSISGDNSDKTPLMSQVAMETVSVSSTAFTLTTEENDIPHTLYYLDAATGAGSMPTVADSVYLQYEGFRLDGTVFDSNTGVPTWLDLPVTVRGFREGLSKFKAGGDVTLNDDGTFTVANPGVGLIFMPSGLAYFGGAQPGESYAPIVFEIELVTMNTSDHDQDGIPSILEDLNNDRILLNDNTDEGVDAIPNYLDNDDDGDGTPTRDEIIIDTDGNITYPDTDGDGVLNYLDPDDSESFSD